MVIVLFLRMISLIIKLTMRQADYRLTQPASNIQARTRSNRGSICNHAEPSEVSIRRPNRDLQVKKDNLNKLSSGIAEMLDIFKRDECRKENRGAHADKVVTGLYEYRRRINYWENLQEIHEAQLLSNIGRRRQAVISSMEHAYPEVGNTAQDYHYEFADRAPVSRPSGAAYIAQKPDKMEYRRPMMANNISGPKSKYLRHLNQPQTSACNQQKRALKTPRLADQSSMLKIESEEDNESIIRNLRSEDQNKRGSLQDIPVEKFELNEDSLRKSQTSLSAEVIGSEQEPSSFENKGQIRSPYRSDFQIKVYPCNLDKESIKVFIAERLAAIVKVDMQFDEYKKLFMDPSFAPGIPIAEKRSRLVKCLWSRGFMISERELDTVIIFDDSSERCLLSSEAREGLGTFEQFLEIFVNKYLQAEYEWQRKVMGMLPAVEIDKAYFRPHKLDLEQKGYLKLEDLTCFVNLFASESPCFKNKSLRQLFHRFCREEPEPDRLPYQSFLQIITKQQ